MREVLEKLIAEYGLDKKKDPYDGSPIGCYHGFAVIYQLSYGLLDVYDKSGTFLTTSSEETCREWLNEILEYLKTREREEKLKKLNEDFK